LPVRRTEHYRRAAPQWRRRRRRRLVRRPRGSRPAAASRGGDSGARRHRFRARSSGWSNRPVPVPRSGGRLLGGRRSPPRSVLPADAAHQLPAGIDQVRVDQRAVRLDPVLVEPEVTVLLASRARWPRSRRVSSLTVHIRKTRVVGLEPRQSGRIRRHRQRNLAERCRG
jgi:hypothetical protein